MAHSIISHRSSLVTILRGGQLRGIAGYRYTTGERLWQSDAMTAQDRFGTAYFVKNDDRYFVMNDAGELFIARFTPEGGRGG
ncbi:MAG: hypothetical protein Ct9H300mP25_14100 [Acidobacteriota bacterium]|nr:MAG: hypothetical protein Ct9H300mP25_14100 [Acidobacteriota bacterium]